MPVKFEKNIYDTYTTTWGEIGADNKDYTVPTGATVLTLTTPSSTYKTLQEIIDFAVLSGDTDIVFQYDTEFDEVNIQIPGGLNLWVDTGYTVNINMTNFSLSRLSNSDIAPRINSGGNRASGTNQYSPITARNDTLYVFKTDGTFTTKVHSNISGKQYIALTEGLYEDSVVFDGVNYQYHRENSSGVTIPNFNSTKPKILDPNYNVSSNIWFTHTSDDTVIKYGPPATPSFSTVTIKDTNNQNFSAEGWDIFNCSGCNPTNYGASYLAYGLKDGQYVTYLYTAAFTQASIIKTIPAKIITIGKLPELTVLSSYSTTDNPGYRYYGGSQVWKSYPGTSAVTWVLELSLDFEPVYADFILAENIIYYIASNTDIGRLDIWKKDVTDENNKWVRSYKGENDYYIYLSHDYSPPTNSKLLRILFLNASDNKLYHFINYTIEFRGANSSLNGFKINNNANLYDLGEDLNGYIYDNGVISYSGSSSVTNRFLYYCDIDANDLHGVNRLWRMQKCIIKTEKDGMHFKEANTVTQLFSGVTTQNLIIAGETGVYMLNTDSSKSLFTSSTDLNNFTIIATNGILLSDTDSNFGCVNHILDCSNYAIKILGDPDTLIITTSIINGLVGDHVDVSNIYNVFNTNPLFIDPDNDNYKLQSIMEYYPKTSKAISINLALTDAGCHSFSYTNNGETEKETITYLEFVSDIITSFENPFKENGFDYQSNYQKNMGERSRVFILREQEGVSIYKVITLQSLNQYNEPLRFYPLLNSAGVIQSLPYVYDRSTTSWLNDPDIVFNFSDMTGTPSLATGLLPAGMLKGAWIKIVTGSNPVLYIADNDEDYIYLENPNDLSLPSNGTYKGNIEYYLVKTDNEIGYENGMWYCDDQRGKAPEIKLYVVDNKGQKVI